MAAQLTFNQNRIEKFFDGIPTVYLRLRKEPFFHQQNSRFINQQNMEHCDGDINEVID